MQLFDLSGDTLRLYLPNMIDGRRLFTNMVVNLLTMSIIPLLESRLERPNLLTPWRGKLG